MGLASVKCLLLFAKIFQSTEEEIVRGSIEALKYIFASQIKNGDLRLDPKENKCMDEDEISGW